MKKWTRVAWGESVEARYSELQPGDLTMYRTVTFRTGWHISHDEVTVGIADLLKGGVCVTLPFGQTVEVWKRMEPLDDLEEQIIEAASFIGYVQSKLPKPVNDSYTARALIEAVGRYSQYAVNAFAAEMEDEG